MRLTLLGDKTKAANYIGWAKKKLAVLREYVSLAGLGIQQRRYELDDVSVLISICNGQEEIYITGKGIGTLIICHVGDDTGISGYTKKFYRLSGDKLVELNHTVDGVKYSVSGLSLIDDGKYFLDFDGNTHDDPDGYVYNFNTAGLVAEDGSGRAGFKTPNRFILNQSFEEEFFRAFVTSVDGTERSYLVLDDSLTFRTYKIKGNPVFNRYTSDSILYLHSRTKQDGTSPVLINDMYGNGGISDGFGDNLFVINKLYKKKIYDATKTSQDINSDAIGTALWGAVKYVRKNVEGETEEERVARINSQKVGRAKTSNVLGASTKCAEPNVIEKYSDVITTEQTFNRCADGGNSCYFMRGRTVSGTTKDPYNNILEVGYSTIANDVKLPYSIADDGKLTYVRVQKDVNFTQVNIGLYVADTLIEESGNEVPIILCDASDYSGVIDNATGKKVMENNGPIVIRPTLYTILHAHHSKDFDAVLYKKTVYKAHSQDLLPYRKQRVCGSQAQVINGQLKRTLVESESTYWIVVNGIIKQLLDANNLPYKYLAREYTLTAESKTDTNSGYPLIYTWQDTPWVDIGYDKDGNLLNETNRQVTRIFATATPSSILFSFDIWGIKSRHNLIYSDANPSYKYLWADYDTGITVFPPSADLFDIADRKWLLFNKDGEVKEISSPMKTETEKYNRVNGVLLMEA